MSTYGLKIDFIGILFLNKLISEFFVIILRLFFTSFFEIKNLLRKNNDSVGVNGKFFIYDLKI